MPDAHIAPWSASAVRVAVQINPPLSSAHSVEIMRAASVRARRRASGYYGCPGRPPSARTMAKSTLLAIPHPRTGRANHEGLTLVSVPMGKDQLELGIEASDRAGGGPATFVVNLANR